MEFSTTAFLTFKSVLNRYHGNMCEPRRPSSVAAMGLKQVSSPLCTGD